MFADKKKVGARRIKRRLKAAASIIVALAAGTFLACRKDPASESAEPNDDATSAVAGDPASSAQPAPSASASATATPSATASATSTALATTTPSGPAAPKGKPTVDRKEHRKGMPVPDNLLE